MARNFLASWYLVDCLLCVVGSAELRVLTLLGSPAGGEGAGCAGRLGAADVAFLSAFVLADEAGIPLVPATGCAKLLIKVERRVKMMRGSSKKGGG